MKKLKQVLLCCLQPCCSARPAAQRPAQMLPPAQAFRLFTRHRAPQSARLRAAVQRLQQKLPQPATAIALGSYFSGAILEDGSLYMWGKNDKGQLGDGTTEDRSARMIML